MKNGHIQKIEDSLEKLVRVFDHGIEFITENRILFQFVFTESRYLDRKHLRIVLESVDKDIIGFRRQLLREVSKEINQGSAKFCHQLYCLPRSLFGFKKMVSQGYARKQGFRFIGRFYLEGIRSHAVVNILTREKRDKEEITY